MRATYEDLLRTARRMAVNAHRGTYPDEVELMADWEAVLAAAASHLRWLRCRVRFIGDIERLVGRSDNSLRRLARALGAGADLLATQDPAAATALDDQEDLIAARAEVAAVVLIAARVVLRRIRTRTPGHRHLLAVTAELETLVQADARRAGLGPLGRLAAAGPPAPVDELSSIARTATRWARAHDSTPPMSLLTRDLRSATAQIRTICGYVSHLVDQLLTGPAADLDAGQQLDLKILKAGLRSSDDGGMRVARSWRHRLSDLSGQGDTAGEIAFGDLRGALDDVVRRDGRLLSPAELVRSRRIAVGLLDAVDELVWSTDRVARYQQHAVGELIRAGRLFVPRHQAAKVELLYLRRPGGGSRPLQARWVRTNIPDCFDELTQALAWCADHLTVAAEIARRLAGTAHLSRPVGDEHTRAPAPYLRFEGRRPRSDTGSAWIADPGQITAELER
jgi:hypothetical protein